MDARRFDASNQALLPVAVSLSMGQLRGGSGQAHETVTGGAQ